jgi:alpha-ketoglutarate-dependent taurine dioxygenase
MGKEQKIVKRYLNIETPKGFLLLRRYFHSGNDPSEKLQKLAHALGTPSTADGDRAIWDVRPVSKSGTFSAFHTDGAYLGTSPKHFLLACVNPARRGGHTLLKQTVHLAKELLEAGWSHNEIDLLRRPVWRWIVPAIFHAPDKPSPSQPKSILSDDGSVAWRFDNLVCPTTYHQRVAEKFHDFLAVGSASTMRFLLGAGDVLLCSNRYVLHGRSGFSDPTRHLLRIRID